MSVFKVFFNQFNNKKLERILIVDDDRYMCKSLSYVLKDEGYKVETAHDVNSALSAFKKKEFDLVLMDYKLNALEDQTGLVLLERVKDLKPETKAIMISAYGNQSVKEKARKMGAQFLDKPFMLVNLLKKIKSCFGGSKIYGEEAGFAG